MARAIGRMMSVVGMVVTVAACAGPRPENGSAKAPFHEQPIVWRGDADCMADPSLWAATRAELEQKCRDARRANSRDLVALSLSGGGTKAAVFGGETLFYLQALGLLQQADLMSSVSGGSFAASLYALTCDPGDTACLNAHHWTLPAWEYDKIMPILSHGYSELVWDAFGRFLVPFIDPTVSGTTFADFIDRYYFPGAGSPKFSDLNPRRPHLILNSTLVNDSRPFLEENKCLNDRAQAGYLRRRTSDEFFHFAFTDYYFGMIDSDLADLRLSYGVAASAAFPLLVDYVGLNDFSLAHPPDRTDCPIPKPGDDKTPRGQLLLTDGGANDNQGLIEVYVALSELLNQQARSPLALQPGGIEAIDPERGDHVLALVINSSLTEDSGKQSSPTGIPRSGWLLGTVDRVSSAIDTYSAVGYNLRKRLYSREIELRPQLSRIFRAQEIGLTELNRYPAGGVEASLWNEAGLIPAGPIDAAHRDPASLAYDPDLLMMQRRVKAQAAAFARFQSKAYRESLGLSTGAQTSYHPQCLYEESVKLDGNLDLLKLPDGTAPCLQAAARWAVALRAQELCDAPKAERGDLAGFRCDAATHKLSIDKGSALGKLLLEPLQCDLAKVAPQELLERLRANTGKVAASGLPAPADDIGCRDMDAGPDRADTN